MNYCVFTFVDFCIALRMAHNIVLLAAADSVLVSDFSIVPFISQQKFISLSN